MNEETVKKGLENIDKMVLVIKAKGGFKDRQKLKQTDHEIDKKYEESVDFIKYMYVSLVVAEEMLAELPLYCYRRKDEYERRRAEAYRNVTGT